MKKIIIPFVFLSLFISCNETYSKKEIQKKEKTKTSISKSNEASFLGKDTLNTNILAGTQDTDEPTILKYWKDDSTTKENDFTRNFEPVSDGKNVNSKVASKHKVSNGKKKKRKFFKSIAELFKSKKPKAQSFEIAENDSKEFTGTKGTYLNIPSNAFKAKDGSNVTYPLKVDLEEYYDFEDFAFSNFSTETSDKIIETGGTVVINAKDANDKELELKPGKEIEIGFPAERERQGMQLFNGFETSGEVVKWRTQIEEKEIEEDMEGLTMRIHTPKEKGSAYSDPSYPAGFDALNQYFEDNFNTNLIDFKNPYLGKVSLDYHVSKQGEVSKIRMSGDLHSTYKNEVLRVFKSMSRLKPAKKMGQKVAVNHKMVFEFKMGHKESHYTAVRFKDGYFDKITTHYRWITHSYYNNELFTGYMFSSRNIGAINCDRFRRTFPNESLNNFVVRTPDAENCKIQIYFKEFSGMLTSNFTQKTKQIFTEIPNNQAVMVVATKLVDGKPYMYVGKGNTKNYYDIEKDDFKEINTENFNRNKLLVADFWGSKSS